MKTCVAAVLCLFSAICFSQTPVSLKPPNIAAYPESEADLAWRGLAAGYIRKAQKDQTLDMDRALNARVDAVMAAVGAAVAAIEPRFASYSWKAILIEDFGHGAAAFPGGTILVDAKFVRSLRLNDHELAMILCHEAAHVVAGHASAKLSFMAEFLGKEKIPTARTALIEFLAKDSYAEVFQPTALMQEREADSLGAAILLATGYDAQRALGVFDKLAARESIEDARVPDSHDAPEVRKKSVSGVLAELRQLHAQRGPASQQTSTLEDIDRR